MGEDPARIREEIRQTRTQLEDEREVDLIRDDIDQTRTQMGETMGALGDKADVKSRVKENVSQKKDAVVGTLSSGKDAVVGSADAVVSRVTGVVPDTQQVKTGAAKVGISTQNPLGLMIGGAAVGFIAGLLAPSTRVEDQRLGEMSDQVKETVRESGQEVLDRGRHVAQEVASTAKETASEQTSQQAEELTDSLKQSAREVAPTRGSAS